MTIIETCPECGSDLLYEQLMAYPPIRIRRCAECGWSYSEQEEVIRVPFQIPSHYASLISSGFSSSACINCSNNPNNGGSGMCGCTLGMGEIT